MSPVFTLTVLSDQALLDVSDIGEEVTHCCDLSRRKEGICKSNLNLNVLVTKLTQ